MIYEYNYNLSDGIEALNIPTNKFNELMRRWWSEDYGDISPEDVKENNRSLNASRETGCYECIDVMGSYKIDDREVWVWARGSFTPLIMLPEEY